MKHFSARRAERIVTARSYADELMRYRDAIGSLDWAAPQDWMCEPVMLAKTGMTVAEHQARTTLSVLELRRLLSGEAVPIVPVLQGWRLDDYLRHVEQYRTAGVDLTAEPLVGLGSVFGMKGEGIALYGAQLETADSMAWSYAGRRRPDPDCPAGNVSCANCLHYALSWRESALAGRQVDAGCKTRCRFGGRRHDDYDDPRRNSRSG